MKLILQIKLYKTDLIYNIYPIDKTDIKYKTCFFYYKIFKVDNTLKHLQIKGLKHFTNKPLKLFKIFIYNFTNK